MVSSTFAFLLLHLAPGDPISAIADTNAIAPELRAQWRHEQGYDRPLIEQYGRWLNELAHGDFGYSSWQHRPVSAVLADRLPNTLQLMSAALLISVLMGAAIGAWQGARAGSRADRAISSASIILYAVPEFVLGVGLLWLVVLVLHSPLPAGGMYNESLYDTMTLGERVLDRLRHAVLPLLSLSLVGSAVFARYQRAAVQDVSGEAFVRTARAKGMDEPAVRKQVRRAARLPVITLTGLFFPSLLTGAVFVEKIYAWPGMGDAMLNAITQRDYKLVSACVVIGSIMTALGTLLADAARLVFDPRLRASQQ